VIVVRNSSPLMSTLSLMLVGVVSAALVGATPAASAIGPCHGSSAPLIKVQVKIVGQPSHQTSKVILNLQSDVSGIPSGKLKFERGDVRLQVSQWCRMWVTDDAHEGSESLHVLGLISHRDGQMQLLRIDVKSRPTRAMRLRVKWLHHVGHSDSTLNSDEHSGWSQMGGHEWMSVTQFHMQNKSGNSVGE